MDLLLTGSRDQALVAMVIEEARKAADESGCFVGRTALQKVLYFLKSRGVPMGYSFDIYHYGPFCDEVLRDAEWLLADHVIVDRSNNSEKYSNYAPGPALAELYDLHKGDLEPHREQVRKIVRALVPLRPERMELIATLDYVYRWLVASGGSGPWKERVVTRFMELKGERFPRVDIERTYDSMSSAGLVGL